MNTLAETASYAADGGINFLNIGLWNQGDVHVLVCLVFLMYYYELKHVI